MREYNQIKEKLNFFIIIVIHNDSVLGPIRGVVVFFIRIY